MTLFLLTGERAAGKTTFCSRLADEARRRGMRPAGILTLTERGVRLDAREIAGGETRLLALPPSKSVPSPGEEATRGWSFRPACLEWGNGLMARAPRADLFILDEAGILEFRRNRGWVAGMERIDRAADRRALVVVRPELVEEAQKRWPGAVLLREDPRDLSRRVEQILGGSGD